MASIGMLCATPGLAQNSAAAESESGEPVLEEITVTAQKRSQNMQQVPIVVNALTADMAAARGINSTTDLPTIAPGLLLNRGSSNGLIYLRGVGQSNAAAGQEGAVAFYLDDVYVYSLGANMFELNNIERVEVLSGPQGTLFGRNALGGVIQIITKEPSDTPSVDARIGYGSYSTFRADVYATGGLASNLAADVALLFADQGDGFGRNLATGKDVFKSDAFSARGKLLWSASGATSLQFSLVYDRNRSDLGLSARFLPGSLGRDRVTTAPADFYDVNQNLQSGKVNKQWIGSGRLLHDFGGVTLKNVVAYQYNTTESASDIDQTPAVINELVPVNISAKTWTEELQVSSDNSDGINWIAGFFYMKNKTAYDLFRIFVSPPNAFGSYSDLISSLDTESYSGYAQATFSLGRATNMTGGLRYTYDKRKVAGGTFGQNGVVSRGSNQDHWAKLSYRLSIDHQFSPGFLGYISYNRGFKAGTFNSTSPAAAGVKPEVLDDYEVGVKTELFDRRLRLNLAGFYYDYKGIQLRQITPTGASLLNAADAEHYGIDASLEAIVTDNFRVFGSMEWLHAKFTDFPGAPVTRRNPITGGNSTVAIDYSGRDMLSAPKFVGSIGAQYKIETGSGNIDLTGNFAYNDGSSWSLEIDDRTREKSYGILNLSAMWTDPSDNYYVKVWGKNVTGTKYNVFVTTSANGDYGTPGDPATFGVTLGAHF